MSVTGVALSAVLVAGAGGSAPARAARACNDSVATAVPQPTSAQMKVSGLGKLRVAPLDRRLDLVAAPFSDPTSVTNPLFPIARLSSVVLNGKVDGKAFRTETTLLPETRIIEWSPGQCVKTLVSQYVAYLDGRIQEVALDFYAQADDGSVWYFGEDVYNYVNGVVADTSGTWLAGKEGPAAMIMPADPKVGDVSRPENIPGLVWEEVATKTVGKTVQGPRGPVTGAMVGQELHDDGTYSDKIFVPGYGEFFTAHEGDVEALAVAIPTDSVPGPPPVHLERLSAGTERVFRLARAKHWRAASRSLAAIRAAWTAHRADGVPPRLVGPANRALRALEREVGLRKARRAGDAALDLLQSALDLQLRYRAPAEIDCARFGLWTRQARVDAAAGRRAALSGDVATLEWLRDRFAWALDSVAVTRIDTLLERLRGNVTDDELVSASRTAAKLQAIPQCGYPYWR
ncbi:MAG TPA: hypothetical protein VES62_14920 [Thermoleophilaceae bacterium]|nr:hypothetical protein [Thermoleophilaceae bacterium]